MFLQKGDKGIKKEMPKNSSTKVNGFTVVNMIAYEGAAMVKKVKKSRRLYFLFIPSKNIWCHPQIHRLQIYKRISRERKKANLFPQNVRV